MAFKYDSRNNFMIIATVSYTVSDRRTVFYIYIVNSVHKLAHLSSKRMNCKQISIGKDPEGQDAHDDDDDYYYYGTVNSHAGAVVPAVE
jgi:hypothetical protein